MRTQQGIETECLFCRIVAGKEKSWTVYEDELVQALLNIVPMTVGHTMIIPKEHYENIVDMPEETLTRIFTVAQKLARKYETNLKMQGLCLHSQGHVDKDIKFRHYHLHIIPRYDKNDPRDPGKMWPTDLETASVETLDKVVLRILS
jgi:histidine triad (HIT) family protein